MSSGSGQRDGEKEKGKRRKIYKATQKRIDSEDTQRMILTNLGLCVSQTEKVSEMNWI